MHGRKFLYLDLNLIAIIKQLYGHWHQLYDILDTYSLYLTSFPEDSTGATLLNKPFQCCCLPNFVTDTDTINVLCNQLRKLKFFKKSNDLYSFKQVIKKRHAGWNSICNIHMYVIFRA